MQNGMTHAAAGDIRAQEATGVLKTGDPAGFNLVDVFGKGCVSQRACVRVLTHSASAAWGALGHAAGFAALASISGPGY
jgi:photosystem I reaction center subunit V